MECTPWHSYRVSLAMWDHTVFTCHPTQVNTRLRHISPADRQSSLVDWQRLCWVVAQNNVGCHDQRSPSSSAMETTMDNHKCTPRCTNNTTRLFGAVTHPILPLVLPFLLWGPYSVISNPTKFGRILFQLNLRRLTKTEFCYDVMLSSWRP